MNRNALTRATKAPPLAQQQVDFTAEGAPPPGTVAGHAPESGVDNQTPASAAVALPKARTSALPAPR